MNTKNSSWCLRTATIGARKTEPLTRGDGENGGACARPLSKSIQPYLGESRSVPPFSDLFFGLCRLPPCGLPPTTQGTIGAEFGLPILLPPRRDREARAILRMPPLPAAWRRLPPDISSMFFLCLVPLRKTKSCAGHGHRIYRMGTARRSSSALGRVPRAGRTGCSEDMVPRAAGRFAQGKEYQQIEGMDLHRLGTAWNGFERLVQGFLGPIYVFRVLAHGSRCAKPKPARDTGHHAHGHHGAENGEDLTT
ncbi:MAG: hypothetical protein JWR26_3743 [Pedosphaera sp.]|nr:hypothetical protein [Pedosphaera sp.]